VSTLLDGVRVLDLTRLLPGGFATGLLADLGAEVIKIERPGVGDYMRWGEPRIGEESAASWVIDRGKRSIGLNLKEPRGVEVLRRLVPTADVLIESFRPGVADRLGVGYEPLRELQPRLVYCSLSGYGQDGPLEAEAGHDLNYVGRAGQLSISGWRDGLPAIPGVQVGDLGGSLLSVAGILAALLNAERTGQGDHIDVSLTDAAFALLSVHLGDYFATGVVPERERMPLNGLYPCYNLYACADGKCLAVGALEEQFFAELCEAVGRPDLAGTHLDPAAVPIWRSLFESRPRDAWLALLEGRDVCVGPVNDVAEACAEPLFAHREMIVQVNHPAGGSVRQVGVPIKARTHPGRVGDPAPPLGEGTKHYLSEVGYSGAEIEELLAAGVVSTAPAPPP
jgi:crotonobetainyl-CoA:carnitine CoA-transferase CaiB-like acyl-CoA transferase